MKDRLLVQVIAAHGSGEAGIAKTYLSMIAAGLDPVKVAVRDEVLKATASKDVVALRALSSRLTAIYNARANEGYTVSQTDLRDMGRVIQTLANQVSTGVLITSTMAVLKNYYDNGPCRRHKRRRAPYRFPAEEAWGDCGWRGALSQRASRRG